MVRRLLISSILLWANALSLKLPYFWDPTSQTWKCNQKAEDQPAVVYIMPESTQVMVNCPGECNKCWQTDQEKNCCDCGREMIVIDTDCDADDAMAISMILNGLRNDSRFSVAGITCTWGSTGIVNVTTNVFKTLQACNRFCDIPVYAGSDFGLVEANPKPSPYGDDAFGDFYYYSDDEEENNKRDEHPAIFMANLVRENPGKVTIVCMGPLCNIALAAHLYSDFYKHVKHISYLGGSANGEGPSWNDELDPYAAMAVFNKKAEETEFDGPKITVYPKELHTRTGVTWDWRWNELAKKGTSTINLLNYAESKKERVLGVWTYSSPLLAAALLNPEIVTQEVLVRPTVSSKGEMTVEDNAMDNSGHSIIRVIQKVKEDKVKKLIYNYL